MQKINGVHGLMSNWGGENSLCVEFKFQHFFFFTGNQSAWHKSYLSHGIIDSTVLTFLNKFVGFQAFAEKHVFFQKIVYSGFKDIPYQKIKKRLDFNIPSECIF